MRSLSDNVVAVTSAPDNATTWRTRVRTIDGSPLRFDAEVETVLVCARVAP
ncbi:MAG: hypothetical protein IRZ32_01470 [Solirubrobacteraceae bacterium]|nr:hypothetical protein [Solirubrobacteraceae bacterium]